MMSDLMSGHAKRATNGKCPKCGDDLDYDLLCLWCAHEAMIEAMIRVTYVSTGKAFEIANDALQADRYYMGWSKIPGKDYVGSDPPHVLSAEEADKIVEKHNLGRKS